jgi:hypothetical protein
MREIGSLIGQLFLSKVLPGAGVLAFIAAIGFATEGLHDYWIDLRHTRIDPQLWCDEIRMSPPHEQARLLVFARPENLGISYDRILRLLIDLQKAVKADPALSIYHAKIAEILELRRQERTG